MSSQPGHTPQLNTSARQATMREFFAVLFRRRWFIVGLFVAVTATVMTISLTTPTTFSSSGRVLVIRGERQSALSPGRQLFSDWEQELASEVANVRSTPSWSARAPCSTSARRPPASPRRRSTTAPWTSK